MNPIRIARIQKDVCGILLAMLALAAAASAQPTIKLPPGSVTVNLTYPETEATPAYMSYFDAQVTGIASGFDLKNGHYLGWCANQFIDHLSSAAYIPYDTYGALPARAYSANWPQINWLLNNKPQGSDRYTQQYDTEIVQQVIWRLLNGQYNTAGYPLHQPDTDTLYNKAMAQGYGFIPSQSQTIALLLYIGGLTNDPDDQGQDTILELKVRATSEVGIFRSGFLWIEDADGNMLFDSPPDRVFPFGGLPGDIPITGDWSGSGTIKVGVYRSSSGVFLLDYNGDGLFDPSVDKVYNLGVGTVTGDVPVAGDWNGDGRTKVGLFRQGYFWILDFNGDGVFTSGVDKAFAFGGAPGDVPVVGDWNGTGTSKAGLFRGGFFWVLDSNGNGQFDPGIDAAFPFGGAPGDVPVVGDWNGDGSSKVGVFRAGYFWVLDANGNHLFDGAGPGEDLAFPFGGVLGDKPVVGKW